MDFHGCGILKSVLRESMRLIRLLGNRLICWKWLLRWVYYSCWLFDTYESICYAPWPEDPDTARNQRNLIPTDGQNSRPFTKIQLLSIGGGIRSCVGEHCSEMDNASGWIPQSRWDPNIMNAIRVPLSPASILWAERLWWFSQQYFGFHRRLHSLVSASRQLWGNC
jgi:hypothetical protein